MTEANHTPGPWSCVGKEDGDMTINTAAIDCHGYHAVIVGGCGCCGSPYGVDNKQELEANARLIAAAPELLEALQMSADYIDGTTAWTQAEEDVLRERLYAAIAKATGK